MQLVTHRIKECEIAEIIGDECLINNEQEAIDLITAMYYKGFDIVILKEQHINPQFYDLSTKLFGEMAQKFSNFRLRVAIIGDFENGKSEYFKQFVWEQNRGKQLNFAPSLEKFFEIL